MSKVDWLLEEASLTVGGGYWRRVPVVVGGSDGEAFGSSTGSS